MLLNLIYYIYQIAKDIKKGSIVLGIDNVKVAKAVNKVECKSSECGIERSVAVAEIKWLIKKLHITVSIEHVKANKKAQPLFQENPVGYMIVECNKEARKVREKVE